MSAPALRRLEHRVDQHDETLRAISDTLAELQLTTQRTSEVLARHSKILVRIQKHLFGNPGTGSIGMAGTRTVAGARRAARRQEARRSV